MYRKLVEAIVEALVPILKKRSPEEAAPGNTTADPHRAGALWLAALLLTRPGADATAVRAKLGFAFRDVHYNWPHTKLAEERIVEAIIA